MVHNPKHKVHSFRGLLGDGGQDEINLERQNLNLAYRIVKFEIMLNTPGTGGGTETIVKIYREDQATPGIDAVVDFSDPDLLGAAYISEQDNAQYTPGVVIVFDNTLFSRNIWVTSSDIDGSHSMNYYIELEEVPVGAATLMQIKLGTARKLGGPSMGN